MAEFDEFAPFRHDGRSWSGKVGTQPFGMILVKYRPILAPGKMVQFRRDQPGWKWENGIVRKIRPWENFLALDYL